MVCQKDIHALLILAEVSDKRSRFHARDSRIHVWVSSKGGGCGVIHGKGGDQQRMSALQPKALKWRRQSRSESSRTERVWSDTGNYHQ